MKVSGTDRRVNMNMVTSKILELHKKIEKNIKLSKRLKGLAAVCLFFSVCECLGYKNVEKYTGTPDKSDTIGMNLIWIISVIVLIGIYIKDSYCVKENKAYELDIYRLEAEDINDKKKMAEIRGEGLADYVLNGQIDMPDEKVSLPVIFYGILLVIDIITRVYIM